MCVFAIFDPSANRTGFQCSIFESYAATTYLACISLDLVRSRRIVEDGFRLFILL